MTKSVAVGLLVSAVGLAVCAGVWAQNYTPPSGGSGGGGNATTVNGGALPTSSAYVGTNSSGQIIAASVFPNYYPTLPAHVPLAATFSTSALGIVGATETDTSAGLFQQFPANTTNNNISAWEKAIPTAPYTIDIAVRPVNIGNYGTCSVYLTTTAGSTSVSVIDISGVSAVNGVWNVTGVSRWTNFTSSFSAVAGTNQMFSGNVSFVRLVDNSTNRIVSYSGDGTNYFTVLTEADTAFITPTTIGLGGRAGGGGSGGQAFSCMWMEYYEH